jgi:UDP-MurNAc hydroxylase
LDALRSHGPVDLHFLQFSGAIWYPMVYDEPARRMRRVGRHQGGEPVRTGVAVRRGDGARYVVPSAGPPCFLDDDLYGFNVITGDEVSIFPDQTRVPRPARGRDAHVGILNVPGTDDRLSTPPG